MLNLGLLLCLLLAHLSADFIFQPNIILQGRNSADFRKSCFGNLKHTGIHFIVYLLCTFYYWSLYALLLIVVVSLSHFVIDLLKSRLVVKHSFLKFNIFVFIIDQLTHITFIILSWYWLGVNRTAPFFMLSFKSKMGGFIRSCAIGITYNQKLLLVSCLLVIGLWGVGIGIRIFFNGLKVRRNINSSPAANMESDIEGGGAPDGGFIIGILERLFIICAIVLKMEAVVGFVLATKSIARFKKFDDDCFVEIFIIGSFMSFIPAITIGVVIRGLNIFSLISSH